MCLNKVIKMLNSSLFFLIILWFKDLQIDKLTFEKQATFLAGLNLGANLYKKSIQTKKNLYLSRKNQLIFRG